MKPAVALSLAAMIALPSGVTWSANAPANEPAGRNILAERNFGEVRFVIGAGTAMQWLEMYVDGRLVAAYRDFDADEVVASPDLKHFLALSSNSKSSYAFAIFDRKGQIEESRPHGGDLHYCNRTAWGIGEWADIKTPQATFSMQQNELTSPATSFLFATVRGCDGKTVILARAPPPPLKATASTYVATVNDNGMDQSSFFIGNAIQNLRGMDPTFAARTLTLVDGRRLNTAPVTTKAMNLPASWTDAPLSERRSCPPGKACGAADLLIHLADGSTRVLATNLAGDFIALPHSRRVFACEHSTSVSEHTGPVVVDLQGNKTSLPSHPGPLRICARAGTGDEVLLVYTVADAGKRLTLARVYDGGGALLSEGTYEKEGTVQFSVAGRQYSESVPGP